MAVENNRLVVSSSGQPWVETEQEREGGEYTGWNLDNDRALVDETVLLCYLIYCVICPQKQLQQVDIQ